MAEELRPEIPRFDEKAQQDILNLASRLAAADAGKVTQTELERLGQDIGLSAEQVRTAIGLYEAKKPVLAPRTLTNRMLEWLEIAVVTLHFFALTAVVGEWLRMDGSFRYGPQSATYFVIALCAVLGLFIRGKLTNLYRSSIVVASTMTASLVLVGLFYKLRGVETVGSDWPKYAVYLAAIELGILGVSWLIGRGWRAFIRMVASAYQLNDRVRP